MKTKQNIPKSQSVARRFHGHLRRVVVPHKGNQYRPHLIRRYGLIAVLLCIVAAQLGHVRLAGRAVLGAQTDLTPAALMAATNQERVRAGVVPLQSNDALTRAAYLKAQDMFSKQYWAHVAPDGTTPWSWFLKVGYTYSAAGENLAKNFSTAEATTAAWMASPEHRQNLLNKNYRDVGYAVMDGVLQGKATTLIVALYGAPAAKAGVVARTTVDAPPATSLSPLVRLGIAVQSLSPAVLGSLVLAAFAAGVALAAHAYRDKLPKHLARSWYRHHGILKAGGMVAVMAVIIIMYSGGQI